MALRDVEHDRARLEQGKIAFFVGRNQAERMQRQMRGLLHRTKRNQANLVGLAHLFQRPEPRRRRYRVLRCQVPCTSTSQRSCGPKTKLARLWFGNMKMLGIVFVDRRAGPGHAVEVPVAVEPVLMAERVCDPDVVGRELPDSFGRMGAAEIELELLGRDHDVPSKWDTNDCVPCNAGTTRAAPGEPDVAGAQTVNVEDRRRGLDAGDRNSGHVAAVPVQQRRAVPADSRHRQVAR
jgi:hypothetical protein